MQDKFEAEQKEIQRVTLWGGLCNIFLAASKIAFGTVVGSIALIADGIHSLSDLLTDIIVIAGTWIGAKPPDKNHTYGHGKYETFAAVAIALILSATGVIIAWEALSKMTKATTSFPGLSIVVLSIVSIVVKEIFFKWTRSIAQRTGSSALMANAWHHRSDALSSVAVLCGGVLSLLGWGYGDLVAGLIVGLMVGAVGVRIAFDSLSELVDVAVDDKTRQKICKIIGEQSAVRDWHKLRTRRVGRQIFMDVHILVDSSMTVQDSHGIADSLEHSIQNAFSRSINVIIHIEPYHQENNIQSQC
jgi:cation diffusion facilitator family transporter